MSEALQCGANSAGEVQQSVCLVGGQFLPQGVFPQGQPAVKVRWPDPQAAVYRTRLALVSTRATHHRAPEALQSGDMHGPAPTGEGPDQIEDWTQLLVARGPGIERPQQPSKALITHLCKKAAFRVGGGQTRTRPNGERDWKEAQPSMPPGWGRHEGRATPGASRWHPRHGWWAPL